MENEQVFTATANIDALSHNPQGLSHRGHDTVLAAAGGFDILDGPGQERSPLLGKNRSPGNARSEEPIRTINRDEDSWIGDGEVAQRSWWNRPSIYWLLPVFLIFTTAFGGSTVPKINLILGLICDQYFSEQLVNNPNFKSLPVILGSDNPQCQTAEVQSRVAKFMLYCNLIAGLLSAVTSPKLGSLSDRYGRTKLMALSMVGMLLNEAIFILAANYPKVVPLQWLFFGFFLEGLGGSFTAAMALTHAYAADCTPPSQRNVVFGYFHSCLFAGIGLGPIVAGYIVKFSGKIITIFYITLACHCFFFVFVIFLVPDSLSKARQLVARQKNSFEEDAGASASASWSSPLLGFWRLSNIFEPLAVLYPKGEGSSSALRRNIVLLAAVDTIMFGVAMGALTVVIIYSEFMFGWNTFETSVFVSIVNCFRVFVLLLFLPIISRVIRGPSSTAIRHRSGSDQLDLSLIRIAILFDLIGYVGYVTARTGPLFVLSGTIASVGAMGSPTLQAALTNHVPTEKSGQVLGAAGLLHALARVVAPTVFNLIYSVTVAKCPQTVFIALSATFGVALVLSLFIRPNVFWDPREQSKISQPPLDSAGEVEVN